VDGSGRDNRIGDDLDVRDEVAVPAACRAERADPGVACSVWKHHERMAFLEAAAGLA
jgi:hypothetical protein